VSTLERHDPIGITIRGRAHRCLDAELVDPLRGDELAQCRPVRRGDSDPNRADRPTLSRDGVKPSPTEQASRRLHELVATAMDKDLTHGRTASQGDMTLASSIRS
jgi:hypothetical protein